MRDLAVVERIKTRARELGVESAILPRLVSEHIEDLGALLENLHEHTFGAFAEQHWADKGVKVEARVEPVQSRLENQSTEATSWNALAENHYTKAALERRERSTPCL